MRATLHSGGNLRADMPETMSALQRANGEFTLETISPDQVFSYERIRSIKEVLVVENVSMNSVEALASFNDAHVRNVYAHSRLFPTTID